MATLPNRSGSALLVVDMQRDVVSQAHDRDRVIANIQELVERARSTNVPVIWVQHGDDGLLEGSDGWQYVDELTRQSDEPLVKKSYGDSFEDTDLQSLLKERDVGHVVVTGAQTDACIRSTLHGALARGYDTTLVGDAHTTEDMQAWGSPISPEQAIGFTNMYWNHTDAPGRTCATVNTADVIFANP